MTTYLIYTSGYPLFFFNLFSQWGEVKKRYLLPSGNLLNLGNDIVDQKKDIGRYAFILIMLEKAKVDSLWFDILFSDYFIPPIMLSFKVNLKVHSCQSSEYYTFNFSLRQFTCIVWGGVKHVIFFPLCAVLQKYLHTHTCYYFTLFFTYSLLWHYSEPSKSYKMTLVVFSFD